MDNKLYDMIFKEKIKRNIFLILQIIFLILTFIGAALVIMKKVDNAGYAVVPMLWSLIFGGFMQNSQRKIKDNSEIIDSNKNK